MGNFESSAPSRFDHIKSLCKERFKAEILFSAITFEELLAAIKLPRISKRLSDSIAEFEEFLNEQNLLSSWGDWLDVVNCAGIPEDVLEGGVYMCPAEGGAYSHHRCRYFGMYRNKRVEKISEIRAVLDVGLQPEPLLKWKNIDGDDADLKHQAAEIVKLRRPDEGPVRVFLLGRLFETNFLKDSPRGMQGSKQYFNVAFLKAKDSSELAEKLTDRDWSDILTQA